MIRKSNDGLLTRIKQNRTQFVGRRCKYLWVCCEQNAPQVEGILRCGMLQVQGLLFSLI